MYLRNKGTFDHICGVPTASLAYSCTMRLCGGGGTGGGGGIGTRGYVVDMYGHILLLNRSRGTPTLRYTSSDNL